MKNDELVVYSNDFNSMPLPKLTEIEMILFMAIISKLKENKKLEFNLLDFAYNLHLRSKLSSTQFKNTFNNFIQKILNFKIEYKTKDNTYNFVCFKEISLNFETNNVKIEAHKDFFNLLTNLELGFTQFKLLEFSNISGKYAKTLYRILKQFRHTGRVLIYHNNFQEFCKIMQIPENSTQAKIDKLVLKPAVEKLNKIFKNLTYKKIKNKRYCGQGGKVVGIEFYFRAERIYK